LPNSKCRPRILAATVLTDAGFDWIGSLKENELRSKILVSILVVGGTFSSPFLLLEVLELRAGGNLWVSYVGGALGLVTSL